MYPDWSDNEYNCAELKFIFAIKNKSDKSLAPSFSSLNDFIVYYNRKTKCYYADFDYDPKYITNKDYYVNLYKSILHDMPIYTGVSDTYIDLDAGVEIMDDGDLVANTLEKLYLKLAVKLSGFLTVFQDN